MDKRLPFNDDIFSNCLSLCKNKVKNRKPEEQVEDLDKLLGSEEIEVNFWEVWNGGRNPTCYMRPICPCQKRIYTMQLHWMLLDVIIMSCTSFRVKPYSIVGLNDKEFLSGSRQHICSLGWEQRDWNPQRLRS